PSRARAPLHVARDGSAGSMVFGRLRQRCNGTGTSNELSAADLLTAWRSQGDDVLQSLTGEFLVAMWDSARGRALLAVDRFSTYPLFWCARNGRLGFSARPAVAAKHAGVALDVDWQSVLAYAYFHVIPAPHCIYRAVHRLDLGEALRVDGGRAETYRYWTPIFDERRTFDFTTERDAFLGELRSGVAECTAGLERNDVGCFLSGGTDSSTIAGLVGRQYGAPARTFSIGFDVPGFDETAYSRLAARHFGTEHTEYFVTSDDVRDGVEMVAGCYEQPFGNASALPTYFCARLAASAGVQRMLGGDGGDELYGGNERYAKQAVFAQYERIPRWLREAMLEPLLTGPMRNVQ